MAPPVNRCTTAVSRLPSEFAALHQPPTTQPWLWHFQCNKQEKKKGEKKKKRSSKGGMRNRLKKCCFWPLFPAIIFLACAPFKTSLIRYPNWFLMTVKIPEAIYCASLKLGDRRECWFNVWRFFNHRFDEKGKKDRQKHCREVVHVSQQKVGHQLQCSWACQHEIVWNTDCLVSTSLFATGILSGHGYPRVHSWPRYWYTGSWACRWKLQQGNK